LAADDSWLTGLKLEAAYFSGRTLFASRAVGGAGAILRFERVRPPRREAFQPLRATEITPRFLDRLIRALKRWGYDIVGIDEVCERAVRLAAPRRFVCLTFDGATKDVIDHAYPVLALHAVPFAVYVPTAFPDRVGDVWWLALEAVIARESRISLMIGDKERHFTVFKPSEKDELYTYLSNWLRTLPPGGLAAAIKDLCLRHAVDLAALRREATMDWADLARLADDPKVTIGSATVNYPVLANLKDAEAMREMTMGKAVLETALHRPVRHLAFPFGDQATFRRAHVAMAAQAGYVSAASTIPGVVQTEGGTDLHALPRIAWDGRLRSLRALKVLISGVPFPAPKPAPHATIEGD
jgi:peptidoglycan/xylan/chitin deacetylase (PgdA/CDA1 family)